VYSPLVLLHGAASVIVQTKNEHVRHLWDAADKFTEYFEQHRIYFTKDVCSKIDGLNSKLSEACSSLVLFFQEAAAIKVTNDQIWDAWKRATDTIESETPKIKELLEQSFRELLWRTTTNNDQRRLTILCIKQRRRSESVDTEDKATIDFDSFLFQYEGF
jgi:hypothetical protein